MAGGQGRGESKTSARRIGVAERRRRSLQGRRDGLDYYEIADLPVDPDDPDGPILHPGPNGYKRANEDVQIALRAIRTDTDGDAKNLRTLQLLRLQALLVSLRDSTKPSKEIRCPDPDEVGCTAVLWREPNQAAVHNAVRIDERISKLYGLDASDENDDRMVTVLEQQVAQAHEAMVLAMTRAGIPPDKQREVLDHAGDILREADAAGDDDPVA